ncbi:MAG: hemerythrin family protein [SAR324 cluster bacterium]|nr:hemerythrin family protein [SAR324 cluster bacterium]
MDRVDWSDAYCVDNPVIDKQHEEIFKRVNMLYDAIQNGNGETETANMLDFLTGYVVSHFNAEEWCMKHQKYPDYPKHKRQHNAFIQKLKVFKMNWETSNNKSGLILDLYQLCIKWLMNHIKTSDQELGYYIHHHLDNELETT